MLRSLEALLFVSDEPVTSVVLAQALDLDRSQVDRLCEELSREYEERAGGLVVQNVAGGWRIGGLGCSTGSGKRPPQPAANRDNASAAGAIAPPGSPTFLRIRRRPAAIAGRR